MLMALLPMAGWADFSVSEPTAASGLKYNGSEQALITADGTVTDAPAGNTVTILYRIADSKPAFNPASHSAWVTKANLKVTNAGTYKVWYIAYAEDDQIATALGDAQYKTVTVSPKSVTEAGSTVALAAPEDVTYKGAPYTFTINVTDGGKAVSTEGFTASYTYSATATGSFTTASSTQNAGYYKQVVTFGGNYTGTLTSEAFQIKKADLMVRVKNKTLLYSGSVYTYTDDDIEYEGFVGTETKSDITGLTVENTNKDAGTYDIIAKGAVNGNYNFVYVKGVLTINPLQFKVYVLPQTAVIGSDEAAITSWTGKDYFSDEATGKYANERIKLLLQTGVDATSGAATFPTTPTASDFVTVNSTILSYFAQTEYTVGEGSSASKKHFITGLTLSRTSGTAAGEYSLTASGATAAKNYAIAAYVPSTFTIGKAEVEIELDNQAKTYGTEDPEWTYTIKGKGGVTLTDADKAAIAAKISVARAEGENVGSYDVTLTVADNTSFSNFTVPATATGKLIITRRPLTITAAPQVLYVGDSYLNIDQKAVTIEGLVKGETLEVQLAFSTEVTTTYVDSDNKLILASGSTKDIAGGIVPSIKAGQEAVLKNYSYTTASLVAGKLTIIKASAVLFLDDKDENLATAIQTAASGTDKKRIVKFSTRVLKANQWNTIVLPFATSVQEISSKLDYAVVDVLGESTSPETISLKLAFGAIPANTPFMVQPAEDKDLADVTFDGEGGAGVTIVYDADPKADDGQGHYFKGTYTGTTVTSADKSEYYYSTSKKQFVNASGSTKIGIMRAFLKDTNAAGAGARVITIEEADGSVTAIDTVETQNGENNGAIYNLQGVRVNKASKGVFIQNGKKVIIK